MKKMIKPKLEESKPYAFDKKVYERELAKGVPDPSVFYDGNTEVLNSLDLNSLRKDMRNIGKDITTGTIQVSSQLIRLHKRMLNIYMYDPEDRKHESNVVLFFHGGGFFGGDAKAREYQCKYLAQQSNALVISLDYRLAPENPFPCGVNDAVDTVQWIIENAKLLDVDAYSLIVAGDSAGANLAANCCLKYPAHIKLAIYIYGALDITSAKDTEYKWDYSLYNMAESQKLYLMNRLYRFKHLNDTLNELYVQGYCSTKDERVSPFYIRDLSSMPSTLIIEAEFDYFKICNDEFAERLEKAGRDVEILLYEGMDHAFFDRIGYLEQAKDCIDEMANRILKL